MIFEDGLKPGIYFGLPMATYQRDKALSRSNIVALVPPDGTAYTYWEQSWMNHNRVIKPQSDEMEYGEAFHTMLFEPETFDKRYWVFPIDREDHGKMMITKQAYDEIRACINVLRAGKASNLFLSGGVSEVTIVFDFMGMRFRVRIDLLGPAAITDFKTCYTLAIPYLMSAFRKYGYNIQLFLYKQAVRTFKEQFMAGEAEVYGKVNEKFFEKLIYAPDDPEFVFIFQRKSHPYPFEPLLPEDGDEQDGMDLTMKAIKVFKKNWELFGTNPWQVSDGKLKRFSSRYGIVEEN